MFKEYIKYLVENTEVMEEYLELKKLGLNEEEISGYFSFFEYNKESAAK